MDRTGKIAVAIAFAVMIGWLVYQSSITPPPKPAGATPSATPALAGAAPQEPPAPQTVQPAAPAPTPEPVLPEETRQIDSPSVTFTFTNHGGGIARALLKNHIVDQESRKNIVLNDYGTTPIGAISFQPGIDTDASCTSILDGTTGITYQRTTPEQIQIIRKYTVPAVADGVGQYIATLDLSFVNHTAQPRKIGGYYIYLGSAAPIHQRDTMRYICMDWYANGKLGDIPVSWFAASSLPIIGHPERIEYPPTADTFPPDDKIAWAAVYDQYFATIVTPQGDGANGVWADRIPLDLQTHESGTAWFASHPAGTTAQWYAINGALRLPGFDLAPKGTYSKQFSIYVGTRENKFLKHMDQGQVAILHLGYSGFVSKGMLKLLIWLQKIVGSYAVAIILLTIAIKAALWPLQNRSTKSMKKMQALTPKMNELREKYKDDPARLNQETIKLYKTYGVNPLAGCLPMVIQLPIFVGFYTMLGSAIELRNSKFFWVHDLSQPDTVGHILGMPINVLPLCMAATSFWMMSMTPKTGDSSQQRMMMFMPLMFLWFCYNYASGLALYFMVSNLCTVLQYYVTKKKTAPAMEKVVVTGKKKR